MFWDLESVRVVAVLAIAFVYAALDIFNNREIPDIFAYASLALAVLLAFTYSGFAFDVAVTTAIAICAGGYLLYRSGVLGAGDVFLAAIITLIIPLQPAPFLGAALQPALPFILSVFVASGYASLIGVVIYYLVFVKPSPLEKNFCLESRKMAMGMAIIVLYALLIVALYLLVGVTLVGTVLLLLLAVPSGILIVFERKINCRMVALVFPKSITPGDMIATNLMKKSEVNYFNKKSKAFGRLVTRRLLTDLKSERKLIPVYKNAVPLAAFIFVGLAISLAYGNLLFSILAH